MEPLSPGDIQAVVVDGRHLQRSLYDFERIATGLLTEEVYRFDTLDAVLIDFLIDAIRLAREYGDRDPQRWDAVPQPGRPAGQHGENEAREG